MVLLISNNPLVSERGVGGKNVSGDLATAMAGKGGFNNQDTVLYPNKLRISHLVLKYQSMMFIEHASIEITL